jgi:hypothetical protein
MLVMVSTRAVDLSKGAEGLAALVGRGDEVASVLRGGVCIPR